MEAGELVGAKLASGVSRYMGVVARRHVIVFRAQGDALLIVRIVHGAQDIEAIAAQLEAGED
jgi:plasmid stabilization system protein ParE